MRPMDLPLGYLQNHTDMVEYCLVEVRYQHDVT